VVLQLLPPICRDCGKAEDAAKLSPYLDFHLCNACIAAREREVLRVGRPPRKPPSKRSKAEGAGEAVKAPKAKTKKRGGRGRRP